MTETKRYTVILRGGIRVEVESDADLLSDYAECLVNDADGFQVPGKAVMPMSAILCVLLSDAITTPTYEPVVQTEESEFEASERARKERGE